MNNKIISKFKSLLLQISFFKDLELIFFRRKWKKMNKHNYTYPITAFDISKVSVGKHSYGPLDIIEYGNINEKLIIGHFCSIADNVKFLLGGEHDYNHISTYPFKVMILGEKNESICKGDIIVEDDVWIGYGTLILSGVKIGQGAVIGANSIVTKDVPPYSIWCGNKVVKKRFDDEIIEKILKINYARLDEKIVKESIIDLYTIINKENYNEILTNSQLKDIIND